jgi:hypothetical protein
MKADRIILILALMCATGCAPVHIHQYLAHGTLRTEDGALSIGVRATTTADPNDPNSFGASEAPGATGFILEFFRLNDTTTGDVANVRGTYSHERIRNETLRIQDTGKERSFSFRPMYAVPTGALIQTESSRIPNVLDYGAYHILIEYDHNGLAHSATGTVNYFHKSHWEIGVMGKGWN